MAVEVVMDGDIAIVRPRGSLVGGNETVELEKAFHSLGEKGNLKLVVDLGKVDLMTSRPLGVLVAALANYTRRDGKMCLCNIDTRIKNLLIITQLIKVFNVYHTLEGALSSF